MQQWWTLPQGEDIVSALIYDGTLVIVSTSMVWYLDGDKLTPYEVVCPAQPAPTPQVGRAQ